MEAGELVPECSVVSPLHCMAVIRARLIERPYLLRIQQRLERPQCSSTYEGVVDVMERWESKGGIEGKLRYYGLGMKENGVIGCYRPTCVLSIADHASENGTFFILSSQASLSCGC